MFGEGDLELKSIGKCYELAALNNMASLNVTAPGKLCSEAFEPQVHAILPIYISRVET